jgi:hypothetical protein
MIVVRRWNSKEQINKILSNCPKYSYMGIFLFGFIPIFIYRQAN